MKWLRAPSDSPTSLMQRCTCSIVGGRRQRAAAAAGASVKQRPLWLQPLRDHSPCSRHLFRRHILFVFNRRTPQSNYTDWARQPPPNAATHQASSDLASKKSPGFLYGSAPTRCSKRPRMRRAGRGAVLGGGSGENATRTGDSN